MLYPCLCQHKNQPMLERVVPLSSQIPDFVCSCACVTNQQVVSTLNLPLRFIPPGKGVSRTSGKVDVFFASLSPQIVQHDSPGDLVNVMAPSGPKRLHKRQVL